MDQLDNYLEIAIQSAKEAGAYLLDHFYENHSPLYKSEFDVGLLVDKESEGIILKRIRNAFPSHNIYSEEIGAIKNESNLTWYIDPLDGTNNYFLGIPYFSVSIALIKNGEAIIGVVFNPITNQLFTATKGGGALLNNKKIESKIEKQNPHSVLSFVKGHSLGCAEDSDLQAKEIEHVLSNKFSRVLKMWAPSLDWCLLALGKIDVLISYESELEDMFAGLLIAQESGIKVYNFDGKEYQSGNHRIIASKKSIIPDVTQLLKNYLK